MTHSTGRALGWGGADPGEPRQSYSNVPGQIGVDPGKLNERTHYIECAPRGQTYGAFSLRIFPALFHPLVRSLLILVALKPRQQ